MTRTLEEILEWRRRHMRELYERLNGDPLAAEVAAKCGIVADDEPPLEPEVQQSTRAIAASLMQASTAGPTPDPDDKDPDQPDNLTVTVAARLRRKDNHGRANFGQLPNQEEE